MSRVLPYPLLTAALLLMWMLLTSLLVGAVPPRRGRRGGGLPRDGGAAASQAQAETLAAHPAARGIVALDILRSNVAVASIILQGGRRGPRSGFVAIPLDLRDRTGLAVLACIVTSTPGTAWIEYDPDTGILLIHVLDLVDEGRMDRFDQEPVRSLLMEIFE